MDDLSEGKGLRKKENSSNEEDDETCEFVKVTPPLEAGSEDSGEGEQKVTEKGKVKEEIESDGEQKKKLPPAYHEVPSSARYSKHNQEPKQTDDSDPGGGSVDREGAVIDPNAPLHAEPEPQGLLRVNDQDSEYRVRMPGSFDMSEPALHGRGSPVTAGQPQRQQQQQQQQQQGQNGGGLQVPEPGPGHHPHRPHSPAGLSFFKRLHIRLGGGT